MASWLSSKPQETSLKILVVSDDDQALSSICGPLSQAGYSVFLAPSAALAIDFLIDNAMPDLLIVDFYEPETEGKEFVEVSRLRFGRKTLAPVLFMMDDKGDEHTAEMLDIDDVLSKSDGSAALVEYVQNWAKITAAK